MARRLGKFVSKPHKIWEWRMCVDTGKLLRLEGHKMAVCERSQMRGHRGPNKYVSTSQEVPVENGSHYCTVEEATPGVWRVKTKSEVEPDKGEPLDFLDVLLGWGCGWMWEDMKIVGGTEWLCEAIRDESLVAATDGSFIRQIYPDVCSACFVLECTKGRGRLMGLFAEKSASANAYRGELLGLMAVHLILMSANRLEP